MNGYPLVSILIPVFKCEDFIENTMKTVKNQDYENLEVILTNDFTPDKSAQIVENFISRNQPSNWKLIHLERNSGLSVVRNNGVENAKGKYVFFLDSDDELYPDTISRLVNLAEKTNSDLTMGEVLGIRLPSKEEVNIFPIHEKRDLIEGNSEVFKAFVNGGFPVSSWNKLIKRDFLLKNNLWFTAGLFAQDALHSFEMALHLQSIAFLREKTYKYFLHANSVIHNRKKVHFDNWITIAEKLNEYYVQEQNPDKKKLILKYLIDFKNQTLIMNWKAQKNEELWKRSYSAYRKLGSLGLSDYFSSAYSEDLKKKNLFISLPVNLGYRFFKWRYER